MPRRLESLHRAKLTRGSHGNLLSKAEYRHVYSICTGQCQTDPHRDTPFLRIFLQLVPRRKQQSFAVDVHPHLYICELLEGVAAGFRVAPKLHGKLAEQPTEAEPEIAMDW